MLLNGEYSIEELEELIASEKSKDKCILTLEWTYSRGFDGIKEQVVLNKEDALFLKEDILNQKDCEIYFGEIAGKHSDIYGTLEEDDINIDYDEQKVKDFLKIHPKGYSNSGHSFLYLIHDSFVDNGEWMQLKKRSIDIIEKL